jgi:hypothetical protein
MRPWVWFLAPQTRKGLKQKELLESIIGIVGFIFLSSYRPSGDVLETFNFLENADDSDEEEENDMIEGIPEGKDKHRMNKHKVGSWFFVCVFISWILMYLNSKFWDVISSIRSD